MIALLKKCAIIVAALAFAMHGSSANAQFYKDKTITIVIGLNAGGTADIFARTFAKVWSKHIPGNPTIIVKNMIGGGATRAQNYVYEVAKPDGLTVYYGPWDPVSQALKVEALRTQYDNIEFVGGDGAVHVTYVRSDVLPGGKRITKPEQIINARSALYVGGSTASAIPSLLNTLSLSVLGVKYKFVSGYGGGPDVRLAMLRNEVQGFQSAITTFRQTTKDEIASGAWLALYYLVEVEDDGSFERNKYVHEMPTYPDLYKSIYGKMPSGPQWQALNWLVSLVGEMTHIAYVRPGTPKEAVEALRTGYAEGMKDPEFVEPAIEQYGIPYSFVDVEKGKKVLGTIKSVDPTVLEEITKKMKSSEGG